MFTDAAHKEKLNDAKKSFKEYCSLTKNVIMERYMFWKTVQVHDETIDPFVTSLRHSKIIRIWYRRRVSHQRQIGAGLPRSKLQERLLRETDLTLEKAINFCRLAETTKKQLKTLQKETNSNVCVIIDMKESFWHAQVDDDGNKLCTFNSPFWRYSFCRLAYGIKSALEVFQKRSSAIFCNIRGIHVIFDDIIIAAEDENEHDDILLQILLPAHKSNICFNFKKLQLKVSSVKYLGLIMSANGISTDKNMIEAIHEMPTPINKAALQRFLGMITYLS